MVTRAIGAVEVRGVSKTFAALEGSDILALDGIALHVPRGEFTAIVGPSGSGKSTLLKIIAGLIPPSDGEILILDEPVRAPSPKVGFVFQTPVLLPWRTVLENTLLPLEISGRITRDAIDQARACSNWSDSPASRPATRSRCRGACSSGLPSRGR